MAWIKDDNRFVGVNHSAKMTCIFLLLLGVFLLLALHAQARGSRGLKEPLWRVAGVDEGELIPLYANQATPFTIVEEPLSEVVKKKVVRPTLTSTQKQEFEANKILKKIKGMVLDGNNFKPDTTNISISALIMGRDSSRVLISNHWLKKGDFISVPMVAATGIYSLLVKLDGLKPELSEIMREQIALRLGRVGFSDLKIEYIERGKIHLVEDDGEKHVIYFAGQS